MSDNKDDASEYWDWFRQRGVNPIDVSINSSSLSIKLWTDETESITNAIKLEGTMNVDTIKVLLPFLNEEKVTIHDHNG